MFGDYLVFLNEANVRTAFKDMISGEEEATRVKDVFDQAKSRRFSRMKFLDALAEAVNQKGPNSAEEARLLVRKSGVWETYNILEASSVHIEFDVLLRAEKVAKGLTASDDRNAARYHARVRFLDVLTKAVGRAKDSRCSIFGDLSELLNDRCVQDNFRNLLSTEKFGEDGTYYVRERDVVRHVLHAKFLAELDMVVEKDRAGSVFGNIKSFVKDLGVRKAFDTFLDAKKAAEGLPAWDDRDDACYYAHVNFLKALAASIEAGIGQEKTFPVQGDSFDSLPVLGVRLDAEKAREAVEKHQVIQVTVLDQEYKPRRSKKARVEATSAEKPVTEAQEKEKIDG